LLAAFMHNPDSAALNTRKCLHTVLFQGMQPSATILNNLSRQTMI
jgi:hypothetical protein